MYDESKYRVLVFNYLLTEKCQQVLDRDVTEELDLVQRSKDIEACTDAVSETHMTRLCFESY